MKSNIAMREMLQQHSKIKDVDFPLSPKLLVLLESPVEEHNGAFLFSKLKSTVHEPTSRFEDLTGYECAVNHVHLEDYVDSPAAMHRESLLKMGMTFVDHLKQRLSFTHPQTHFRIILSCNLDDPPGSVVRFHKIRVGESWINEDNLDGYEGEAILVIDVPGD